MSNTPSPVTAIARIACTKRFAPMPILWFVVLVAKQDMELVTSFERSSENLQDIIDALRGWHAENEVEIKIDMVPGVMALGHFEPIINYLFDRCVSIPDLYSDADFIMARLSMNHD